MDSFCKNGGDTRSLGCAFDQQDIDEESREILKLKARLKEQSNLIALLTEKCERDKASSPSSEGQTVHCNSDDNFHEELGGEKSRADAVSQRFDELAQKFEQLTQIKDSYKEQVKFLEIVVRQNADQNAVLRPLLQSKDDHIDGLKKRICILEREKTERLTFSALAEYENEETTKNTECRIQKLEQQVEEKNLLFEEVCKKCAKLESELLRANAEFSTTRAKLLDCEPIQRLLADRGAVLVSKDRMIARLHGDVEEWRERFRELAKRFHESCAETDADARVLELSCEVAKLSKTLVESQRQGLQQRAVLEDRLNMERQKSARTWDARSLSEMIRQQQDPQRSQV